MAFSLALPQDLSKEGKSLCPMSPQSRPYESLAFVGMPEDMEGVLHPPGWGARVGRGRPGTCQTKCNVRTPSAGHAWCCVVLQAQGGLNMGSKPSRSSGVRCREGREEAVWLGGDKYKSLFRTSAATAQKPQQKASGGFGRAQGISVLIQMHRFSFPILTSTMLTQPW